MSVKKKILVLLVSKRFLRSITGFKSQPSTMTSVASRTATTVNHHPIPTTTIGDNLYCHHPIQKSKTTTVLLDNITNDSRINNSTSSNVNCSNKNDFMNNTPKPYKNANALKMFFSNHHNGNHSSRNRTEKNMEKSNIIQPTTSANATPLRKAANNDNIRLLYNQHAATRSEETIQHRRHDDIKPDDNNSYAQRQQIEVKKSYFYFSLIFLLHCSA